MAVNSFGIGLLLALTMGGRSMTIPIVEHNAPMVISFLVIGSFEATICG